MSRHLLRELRALALSTLVMFFVLEGVLTGVFYVKDTYLTPDPRRYADAYPDRAEAAAYFREHRASAAMRWQPYVYWRRKPFEGTLIHVDSAGIRRSVYPRVPRADTTYRLFFYGGSTLWGTGSPDGATIPSQVGRMLTEAGVDAEIVNLGESGYVSTQEVVDLLRRLQAGDVPDGVVFFDGANDVFTAYQQGVAGWPQNEFHRMQEFNLSQPQRRWELPVLFLRNTAVARLLRGVLWKTGLFQIHRKAVPDTLADAVVHVYLSNVRLVQALARSYGFRVRFYWQPVAFTKETLTAYERAASAPEAYLEPFYLRVSEVLSRRSRDIPEVQPIHRLFAGVQEPLFIDWCHLSPEANRRIARRMVEDILPLIH